MAGLGGGGNLAIMCGDGGGGVSHSLAVATSQGGGSDGGNKAFVSLN